MVYPISSHCMAHQHDEDGGFVIEATTIQDPISFATTLRDDDGPFWGAAARRGGAEVPLLERRARDGRTTRTTASVVVDEDGSERFDVDFQPQRARADRRVARVQPRTCSRRPGATQVCWTGLASTHVQGSCRMGDDPARSAVDRNGEVHGVEAASSSATARWSRARSRSTRR